MKCLLPRSDQEQVYFRQVPSRIAPPSIAARLVQKAPITIEAASQNAI
jgi:hypothetical protein